MRPGPDNAAFSLLEVMCAILILGVALVALTQGIGAALRSTKDTEVQTAAVLLAAGQIESLRADGFVVDGDTDGDGDGALSNYHWTQSVTSSEIDGLHHVKVVVENTETSKTIYELETLLFDPPITPTADDTTKKRPGDKKERRR